MTDEKSHHIPKATYSPFYSINGYQITIGAAEEDCDLII